MSTIAPATDLELIQHLDLEPHVACEHQCDCVRDATVLMICRDCRISGAMCDPCVGEIRQWVETRQRDRPLTLFPSVLLLVCKRCQRQGETLDDLFELVPIGGC